LGIRGKLGLKHGLELTQPEERDQAQWLGNVFVNYWSSQSKPAFRDPEEYAQQGELCRIGSDVTVAFVSGKTYGLGL
jgi:hypothetical protein